MKGHLTVDRERAKLISRAKQAAASNVSDTPSYASSLGNAKVTEHFFWLPEKDGGRVVEWPLRDRDPYEYGSSDHWALLMGPDSGWILPWSALRRGMSQEQILNWPLSTEALHALHTS